MPLNFLTRGTSEENLVRLYRSTRQQSSALLSTGQEVFTPRGSSRVSSEQEVSEISQDGSGRVGLG